MTIHIHPAVIQKHPHYPRWQALIRSHPDGVEGVPLAVGDFTQILVLIDCAGHKLVFPVVEVEALPVDEDSHPTPPAGKAERRAGR
jgi:hypothetical protein